MKVYTAIFAAYDRLRAPSVINPAWDYVCICNPQIPVPAPWHTSVRPSISGRSPRFSARHYKILSHRVFPNTAITIWHGGNVQLLADPTLLLDIMDGSDMAILKHSLRTSPYAEARECIALHKGTASVTRAQMKQYRSEGFPGNTLSAAFLLVRRHTDAIKKFNEVWYSEVKNKSIRDQLSFDYSCWKVGIKPAVIPGSLFRGPHFIRHEGHAK